MATLPAGLIYWWRMSANIRHNAERQWLIEAPSISGWHYFPIARRRIDAELRAFAALLNEAAWEWERLLARTRPTRTAAEFERK